MGQQLLLNEASEFNGIIGEIFSKLSFTPLRNNAELYWVKGAQILGEQIQKILRLTGWTKSEKEFLDLINELIIAKLEKNLKKSPLIVIASKDVKKMSILSIEVMIDRDEIVQNAILEKEIDNKLDGIKETLLLLEMNARLLELVKNRLLDEEITESDIINLKNISLSLVKSYLFLSGSGISKIQLKESMLRVKEIWREYYPISTLTLYNG